MDNNCTYHVEVKGQIEAGDLSTGSPLEMVVGGVSAANTSLTVWTDQSGLIGLVRYLHGRGFVLLSIFRKEKAC